MSRYNSQYIFTVSVILLFKPIYYDLDIVCNHILPQAVSIIQVFVTRQVIDREFINVVPQPKILIRVPITTKNYNIYNRLTYVLHNNPILARSSAVYVKYLTRFVLLKFNCLLYFLHYR